jgi:hypothetical protein
VCQYLLSFRYPHYLSGDFPACQRIAQTQEGDLTQLLQFPHLAPERLEGMPMARWQVEMVQVEMVQAENWRESWCLGWAPGWIEPEH